MQQQLTAGSASMNMARPAQIQDTFVPMIGAQATSMTTYTWRRVAPTVATIAEWSDTNMLALGDWQDSTQRGQSSAKMALHYSSAATS